MVSLGCGFILGLQNAKAAEGGGAYIAVSVSDNSDESRLSADRVIQVAQRPDEDPELYELLGRPTHGFRYFPLEVNLEGSTEAVKEIFSVTQHYVLLRFPVQADVDRIIQAILRDSRFAFAGEMKKGSFSAIPNDTFFSKPLWPNTPTWFENYQWGSGSLGVNLPPAWTLNPGWAIVGVMDSGLPVLPPPTPSGLDHRLYTINHFDLQQVVAYRHSWDYRDHQTAGNSWTGANPRRALKNWIAPYEEIGAHGTHVTGIIAANANNGQGVAGTCWNCAVNFGQTQLWYDGPIAALGLALSGVQVLNLSGHFIDPDGVPCPAFGYGPSSHPICPVISLLVELGTPFVAASGNGKSINPDFPANESEVVGVGGSDSVNPLWDESARFPDSWDFQSGPYVGCTDYASAGFPGVPPPYECGSATGPGQTFVAPARKVLSTLPYAAYYSPVSPQHDVCNDASYGSSNDGIGYCTGTSMSTPFVTGVIGLVRSENPLLSANLTLQIVKDTASNGSFYNSTTGYGVPNAGIAVAQARGFLECGTADVRATPMFTLHNWVDKDRLYTTRPQVASAAMWGTLLSDPMDSTCAFSTCPPPGPSEVSRPYQSGLTAETSPVLSFYEFSTHKPLPGYIPHAAFWVLTSPNTLNPEAVVRPLYRLSFAEECDWRDHIYTTEQAGIDYLTQNDFCKNQVGRQSFHYDAIEGYIFRECPQGFGCNNVNDPSELQALYRRWSEDDEMSALILESQLSMPEFSSYSYDVFGGTQTGFLGFVIVNVDSDNDGLPDGYERLLGLNWLSADTDGDGVLDGVEYPVAGLQGFHDALVNGECL